ncbi:mitochondrial 54S ribosomal protein uL2m NDAI_0C01120 [Naumovozyma dairenensis CBS 421]|uniref:Uncharacterized protein n=1 Tax=Naumovozyma dairenensis (strain ATCC 10597 / BCRC 20456 / CBS 421 / NBRC 0211 / NRRL Y-12639) TaxID=1071378 RepID=G0W7L2_NAUDC|nr:hypothetical protein NDAI_0C01120 [Naumovozyma dairenensis CBS 421]CCD23773.1 hypothetical protein NDAI_0C01120 [Naumovozyma dairenensis CBS 421]
MIIFSPISQKSSLLSRYTSVSLLFNTTKRSYSYSKTLLQQQQNATTTTTTPISAKILQIIPNNTDIATLEKQDELIKSRRKLLKQTIKIKSRKPISPGLRWFKTPIYTHLFKGKPIKSLTIHKKVTAGRNNQGKITVRHRGGGHKRRIRTLDYFRWDSNPQLVKRIEFDPNRSAHIALLESTNEKEKTLSYVVATDGLRKGDIIQSFRNGIPKDILLEMNGKIDPALLSVKTAQRGNCLPISMIPIGSVIHNVGITPVGPAKFCRAAGTYARLISKLNDKKKAIVRLQSGEHRYVSIDACATMGIVSNVDHQNRSLGKAGRSRNLGRRPHVRGVAMNKCDHPHGGGRGKSKSNKLSMSPWGQLAKGYKTRRGKNQNQMKVKDRPRRNNKR